MSVSSRLESYYPFSTATIDNVSEVFERIASMETYQAVLESAGVPENKVITIGPCLPVNIVDIRPDEHDPSEALILDQPMANPLDSNIRFQLATVALNNPDKRIIAAGNPSGKGFSGGRLQRQARKEVIQGNFASINEPLERYLDAQSIETVRRIGYSYGADKAAAGAMNTQRAVSHGVFIEPTVVNYGRFPFGLAKLGLGFAGTAKQLSKYVEANALHTFEAAREDAVGAINYNFGILRLSNLAIARALSRGEFPNRFIRAQQAQPDMITALAWGDRSELADDQIMSNLARNVDVAIRLPGHYHALANDLALQNAIIQEAFAAAA